MTDTFTAKLETILVVDDNTMILNVVAEILKNANFQVLSADNGAHAIDLAEETEGRIDLLLSGVDMPQLSGPDLAVFLKKSRPDLRAMFMLGGENGNLLVLNHAWAFIHKAFVPAKLVEMINAVLHPSGPS